MPYNPTTDESIKFLQTGAKDPFPTVYDAGTPSIPDRFKKVWAEYHNKIKNFIGVVEPQPRQHLILKSRIIRKAIFLLG